MSSVGSRSDLPQEARITSTNTRLNGTMETPLGSYEASVYNTAIRKAYRLLFLVVQSAPTAILGAQAYQEMDLLIVRTENISQTVLPQALKAEEGGVVAQVELEDVLEEYSDVFRDQLGTFQEHVHLHVDHEISPFVMPLRKFPICLKENLRRELDRLEESGVLQKVMETTKWVSSMVIERKKDCSMRLCIVYRVGLQAQANFSALTFEPAHEARAGKRAALSVAAAITGPQASSSRGELSAK